MSIAAYPPLSGMTPKTSLIETNLAGRLRLATDEPRLVKFALIGTSLMFLTLVLFVPLVAIFAEALRKGLALYIASFTDAHALAAIRLTLITALSCVPLNLVFGLAAAWAISKFQFPGKSLLITLIDLPFAVSPVISGLIFVLLFGMQGWLGPWLDRHNIQIIFAVPGIVLATLFVTFEGTQETDLPMTAGQPYTTDVKSGAEAVEQARRRYSLTLPTIKSPMTYRLEIGDSQTRIYKVAVAEKPKIGRAHV